LRIAPAGSDGCPSWGAITDKDGRQCRRPVHGQVIAGATSIGAASSWRADDTPTSSGVSGMPGDPPRRGHVRRRSASLRQEADNGRRGSRRRGTAVSSISGVMPARSVVPSQSSWEQHGGDLVRDLSVQWQRHVADAVDAHVPHVEVGVVEPGVAVRQDHLVEVRPIGHEPGTAPVGRLRELDVEVAPRTELAAQLDRHQAGGNRARVRRAERHQRVHALVAAESLHVVTGDEAAQAVADDVDPLVTRLGDECLDLGGEVAPGLPDVVSVTGE
jgi:hypothetical protein